MKLFRAPRLFRLLFVVLMILGLARMGKADEAADLRGALGLARAGNWDAALQAAGKPGSLGRDLIEWQRLRDAKGGAGFDDYRAFVARRPDWPGMPYLMGFGEKTITDDTPAAAVADWFDRQPPQTPEGLMQAIRAWQALGRAGDAEAEAVLAWVSEPLDAGAEAKLLALFPQILARHHADRMDMLLWRGETGAAERLLPRLPDDWQRLARARMGLRASADGVDGLIAAVPAGLADDPGLAWERYLWRKRKGRAEDALALLRDRSVSADALGDPERWAAERNWQARDLMRAGKGQAAYEVASRHFLQPGQSNYADLEWLSGYLALRFLNDPARALDHFTRFRMAVSTPISLGRAGYWEGRALEAMGAKVDAQAAYEFGAEFQTSFYGLLAAEKAGLPMDPALMGQEPVPDWRGAAFLKEPVVQAGLLALKAGDLDLGERFLRHYAERLDATGLAQMADMALALDEPHLALRIAKYAADQGIVLNRPYYPLHPLARGELPVPAELALSIARRESEFDPKVVSSAGARGLMQLMPGTARQMADQLGLDYEQGKLTTDAGYNARLGAAYLAHLVETFGRNWMLVAAAYNAGPSRPARWLADYGDPRDGTIDPVDWIETIPFEETRNYIMRVTESIPVYRARLDGRTEPITLGADLAAR